MQDFNDAAAYAEQCMADYPIQIPSPEKKSLMHVNSRRRGKRGRRSTYGNWI